ncbi:hypothetical protein V1511DRAFT_496805 [Dipodascopsis uninucleata]
MEGLTDKTALLYVKHKSAIQDTETHNIHDNVRTLKAENVVLEQKNVDLMKDLEITKKKCLDAEFRLNNYAKNASAMDVKLQQREKQLSQLQTKLETMEKELLSTNSETQESMQERVQLSRQVAKLTAEVDGLRGAERDYLETLKEKMVLERKLADAQSQIEKTELQVEMNATEIKALKDKVKELESKLAELENLRQQSNKSNRDDTRTNEKKHQEQINVIEKRRKEEISAIEKNHKEELMAIEKQYKEQIGSLKSYLTKQTAAAEKANRELSKAKDQFQIKQSALESKLESAKAKLKAAKPTVTSAKRSYDGSSLLFTPDIRQTEPKSKRSRTSTDDLLEKSTFSMTPFLNRQSNVLPLSPVDNNRQNHMAESQNLDTEQASPCEKPVNPVVDRQKKPQKRVQKNAKISSNANDSDKAYIRNKLTSDLPIPTETKIAPAEPVKKSVAASLSEIVQKELENNTTKDRKKKRKLGGRAGSTLSKSLFDESIIGGDDVPVLAVNMGSNKSMAIGNVSNRTAEIAAPVPQRAFLNSKEISPLKKRNEKLRGMFKV